MKTNHWIALLAATPLVVLAATPLAFVACNSDNGMADAGKDGNTGPDVVNNPDTGTDSGGKPPPPALLTEIDRFGRPAINTALNHTFDSNAGTAGMAKDTYNADKTQAGWVAAYRAEFAKNLGIYDCLDTGNVIGSGCGNQLLASKDDAGPTRYNALAGLLADDRVWTDTSQASCTTYLGVELGVASECGGRKLDYDVIKSTYGAISGAAGFDDGIIAVPTKTNGTMFPYLAPAM